MSCLVGVVHHGEGRGERLQLQQHGGRAREHRPGEHRQHRQPGQQQRQVGARYFLLLLTILHIRLSIKFPS